ncbi:MAG: hypothetical protein HRU38_14955 [Saccharospirillaceae bacterium]|nr:hypothetical protein [Saccharospirillaceae bacterium]
MFQVREMCQATPKVLGPIFMVFGLVWLGLNVWFYSLVLFVSFIISAYQEWKKR